MTIFSEETRKGMIEKAQQGHWPSCAPIGYRNVRNGQGRNVITIDPEAGPIVTRLFDWYALSAHVGYNEPAGLTLTDVYTILLSPADAASAFAAGSIDT